MEKKLDPEFGPEKIKKKKDKSKKNLKPKRVHLFLSGLWPPPPVLWAAAAPPANSLSSLRFPAKHRSLLLRQLTRPPHSLTSISFPSANSLFSLAVSSSPAAFPSSQPPLQPSVASFSAPTGSPLFTHTTFIDDDHTDQPHAATVHNATNNLKKGEE